MTLLAELIFQGIRYQINLQEPIDLSVSLGAVRCFYAPAVEMTPVQAGDFVGSVAASAPVNFFNVKLNPHGNGTHTECMGHISKEHQSLNAHHKQFHSIAQVLTVKPTKQDDDQVISIDMLAHALKNSSIEALIIRTLPNPLAKRNRDYSGTNPPYLTESCVRLLVEKGIRHLLLDLPSIDREEDGGALAGHKAFWGYPDASRLDCTITELIYVPDEIEDGLYLLNLQTIPLELDASPSRPVLYRMSRRD